MTEFDDEAAQRARAQREAKLAAYKLLLKHGLPVPPDLKAYVEGELDD